MILKMSVYEAELAASLRGIAVPMEFAYAFKLQEFGSSRGKRPANAMFACIRFTKGMNDNSENHPRLASIRKKNGPHNFRLIFKFPYDMHQSALI